MPCEVFRMHFKPVGFFEQNPALDVAPSTQNVNKSRLAFDASGTQTQEAAVEPACCRPRL